MGSFGLVRAVHRTSPMTARAVSRNSIGATQPFAAPGSKASAARLVVTHRGQRRMAQAALAFQEATRPGLIH
jgi:hypothetical protein